MSEVSTQETKTDAPEVNQVDTNKQAHLKQLADAREKARLKRKQNEERMALMEKQLAQQEAPKPQPVVAIPETTDDEVEIKEPVVKKPRVVVREKQVVPVADEAPSLSRELLKTAIVGMFTVGSFYFANIHFRRPTPKPVALQQQEQQPFSAPFIAPPRPSFFARPEPRVPVGSSGFWR